MEKNCEEERLLGVSITGQWDSPAVRNPKTLRALKEEAIKVNQDYAKRFGINASTCITCVKPSGTVSQLVDAASGMHPRHAPYYIRRIRISASDPLFKMLKDQKFPYKPEVGQVDGSATTYVLEFPVKAPDNAIYRDDLSALDQLEHWKMVKMNYTEHNPSVTVSVSDEEWLEVGNWLYKKLGYHRWPVVLASHQPRVCTGTLRSHYKRKIRSTGLKNCQPLILLKSSVMKKAMRPKALKNLHA